VLADALLEKFGGDSLEELRASLASAGRLLEERFGAAAGRAKRKGRGKTKKEDE
jgi:hypothetical protein